MLYHLVHASFLDELEKIAVTRSVKEWRKAQGAGDTATADQIAQGAGQLGLKPRYLQDISLGGAEAGVDKMMGSARAALANPTDERIVSPRRALGERLDQYKANKDQLGLGGRAPTNSVKQSPDGRAALLRGTQAPQQAPAPNESGYLARKMYKPDSYITQAEFTPEHLEQKMQMTQTARSLSPEAKSLVPDMYGHTTKGFGPTQRSMSYHEYVPGLQDLRGKNIGTEDKPIWSNRPQAGAALNQMKDKVLNPLQQKGMQMLDVVGAKGTNWGNVASSTQGPKIVDFLPKQEGQTAAASKSFLKYAPMPVMRHSAEGGGTLQDLRKEMYKPTMQSRPATPEQVDAAVKAHKALVGETTPAPGAQAAAKSPVAAPARSTAQPTGFAPTQPVRPAPAPVPVGNSAMSRPTVAPQPRPIPMASGTRPLATKPLGIPLKPTAPAVPRLRA